MVGIYKIENPKGKTYIGQSTDIEARIYKGHKYNAGSGKKLKNSFSKYGFENHKIEILEECSINDLTERETYWIEYYNSYKEGLNSTKRGGIQGYRDIEHKKNQSKGLKGRKGYWENKSRPNHSKLLKEKGSGLSYERTKEHRDSLSLMMKGVWEVKGKEISKKISQNKIGKGLKPIICETLYGMEFDSTTQASKILGLNKGNICGVLKGDSTHTQGFTFTYKKDFESQK